MRHKRSLKQVIRKRVVSPAVAKTASISQEQLMAALADLDDDKRRRDLARLVKQARTDAGMTQVALSEALGVNPNTGRPFHKNTIQNWERMEGSPDLWFREIEEATGKPAGWFEYQLDPYSRIVEMADEITAIRKQLAELLALTRKLL